MSYQESFWVALAAATPVIALANTVSITDVTNTWSETARELIGSARIVYILISILAASNFIFQAYTLSASLLSLYVGSDEGNAATEITFTVLGLIAVLATTVFGAYMRFTVKEYEESKAKASKTPDRSVYLKARALKPANRPAYLKVKAVKSPNRTPYFKETDVGGKAGGLGWPDTRR